MKVGDLVKVYNFSHRARNKFRCEGINVHWDENVDAHFVGLIVGDTPGNLNRGYRQVLSGGDMDFINLDRMEIINESR